MAGTAGRSGGDHMSQGSDFVPQDSGPIKPALSSEVAAKWDQLLEQIPRAALRSVDVHELRLLSELLARSDQLADQMRASPTDCALTRLYLNVCSQIHRMSASLGLTPGDRKRMALPAEFEDDDPYVILLNRLSPASKEC